MSAEGNEKLYQELIKTGKFRIGPIELEDRLKLLGFEIEHEKTWEYLDFVQADRETLIDCKFIYPKERELVDVLALTELRKSVFVLVNGFYWVF